MPRTAFLICLLEIKSEQLLLNHNSKAPEKIKSVPQTQGARPPFVQGSGKYFHAPIQEKTVVKWLFPLRKCLLIELQLPKLHLSKIPTIMPQSKVHNIQPNLTNYIY